MNIFPQTHSSEGQTRLFFFIDWLELAFFLLLEYGTLFCALLKNRFYLDLFNDSKFKKYRLKFEFNTSKSHDS